MGVFKAKQELLIRKHQSARKRADSLCVGGGVSLWPEMARMRLTCAEGAALVVLSAGLVVLTAVVFHLIHGTCSLVVLFWQVSQITFCEFFLSMQAASKHLQVFFARKNMFLLSCVIWA